MRIFYLVLLLLFIGALVAFAIQNRDSIEIKFVEWKDSYPLPVVLGVVYLLGMFSGWSVVGLIRRSINRVAERQS